MSRARSSAISPSDSRFAGRDGGIGASPVPSSSSMPRSRGMPGGAPPGTSAYFTLSAANAGSSAPARRSSASGRQRTPDGPRHRRSGRHSGAPAGGRAAAEREPPAVACFRGQQGRRDRRGAGGTIPSSDVAVPARAEGRGPRQPLDLAEEPAKLPVADNRQRARREASPGGQEGHQKLCRPRLATDAAVHVKEAQIAARDPVAARDQVVADAHIPR